MERVREAMADDRTEIGRATLAAMEGVLDDPFQGAIERRVMPDDMKASDMETAAAREVLDRVGISVQDIDAVLSHQICPDFINVPSAAVVHGNLGLRERAQAVMIDAACNSFANQLVVAQGLIASGRARYVLCTQSSSQSRLPATGEVIDTWVGDAASAVIIGPVREGRGLRSATFHTNGKLWGSLVCGVPGDRWQNGRCSIYSEDPKSNLEWVTRLPHLARVAVDEALIDARIKHDEVSFFASHQGFRWLHAVTLSAVGLAHSKSVEHFTMTAAISSVSLPLQFALGQKEGLLKPDDIVVTFQGGTGMTWSATVLKWGT